MSGCKDCVHYGMCLETFRNAKEQGDYSNITEEEYFSSWFDCDFFLPQSRFIELPCEVGQTVWFVPQDEIFKATVIGIEYNRYSNPQEWIRLEYISHYGVQSEYKSRVDLMLGKTVFLSREEAKKALKEREKERQTFTESRKCRLMNWQTLSAIFMQIMTTLAKFVSVGNGCLRLMLKDGLKER